MLNKLKELLINNEVESVFVCEEFGYATVTIGGEKLNFEPSEYEELFEII